MIVLARCGKGRSNFGIRFEEKGRGQWVANWSFAIKETAAKKEGYDKGEISGTFIFDEIYPGCAYCRAHSILKCGCGKVSCWDGEKRGRVTCPWCNFQGEIGGPAESIGAGKDK